MSRSSKSLITLVLAVVAVTAGIAWLIAGETPSGAVRGTLVAAETGMGLPETRVSLTTRREREDQQITVLYTARTDAGGRFVFPRVTAGQYQLMAYTQAHEAPKTVITVSEGKTTEAAYEMKPVDPFLRVFERQRVFTTREEPKLRVHGFVPAREMTVSAFRVRDDLAVKAWEGALYSALGMRREATKENLDANAGLRRVHRRSHPVTQRDVEGIFREEISLGPLSPGMYVVAFDARNLRALTVVTVTNIGLVLKAAPGQAVAYVADIETGEPISGAEVSVLRGDAEAARGVSGADGMFAATLPTGATEQQITAVARWSSSIASARAWLFSEDADKPLRVYTYTDRPVYRPGHHVYLRSILRELRNGRYSVPAGEAATIRVSDPNDETIYSVQTHATDLGSLSAGFDLNAEARPGLYTVRVQPERGGTYEASFMVAEYRKPEYEVTVTPAQKRFTRGDTVTATISARYFYGAPVPNARVTYYVTRAPHWFYEDGSTWDEDLSEGAMFAEEYGEGEYIGDGEGRTDDSGQLEIQVPLEPKRGQSRDDAFPDADDQDWRYTVHASVSDVAERTEDGRGAVLVSQGDYRLNVEPAQYLARPGQPVEVDIRAVDYDGKPVAGASGEVETTRREWNDGEERVTKTFRQPFQADAEGRATVQVTPDQDGDWRVRAIARDEKGNTIRSSAYLWVMSGDAADFSFPYQDLQVRADKRLYNEGDTAEIVVNTKHAPQTALLTLESGGVMERRLVRLTGKSTVLKVDITRAMMPSVRASVCFIRDKAFVTGDAVLNITRERRALNVTITSDKETYQPGEPAVYTVKTQTPEGRGVAAEVSLGVVDSAIYAIAPDTTPNIVAYFYPKRIDEVRTAFSFPEVYLSGDDKAGSTIRTRRNFPDTAFWRAATVTDAHGTATFRFTMPDNLTTWRATCRAATADTRVGQATQEAVVQKPYLVRLVMPRFLTQGDEAEVAGVTHNLTQAALDAQAGLEPGSLTILRSPRTTARVNAGALERFAWNVRAEKAGSTEVRVWTKAGALDDAMALPISVLPRGRTHADSASAAVVNSGSAAFQVRQDAIPGTARLEVRLSPSLVAVMFGALDYLANYPYGCAEQTMSAFLPDVVLSEMLRSKEIRDPALERRLPDMVRAGLSKIQDLQNPADGGFGWWRYDDSDPWMTVYVTYGLLRARDAGFAVSPNILDPARQATRQVAAWRKPATADARAFAAYVLTLAGEREAAAASAARFTAESGAAARAKLSDWGASYLALALARSGREEAGRTILQGVWTRVVNRKFVPLTTKDTWRSDAEYGAALLYAGCELTPNQPRMGDLVRWLVDQRRGNRWTSTRDTAQVLYAFSRYVALTGELNPDYAATVTVNGKAVRTKRFTAADVMLPETVVAVEADQLPTGPVEVRVAKTGAGRLYYTATLTQVAAEDLSVPVRTVSGLNIERTYRRHTPGRPNDANTRSETRFQTGDVVDITITLRASAPFEYIMIEDPLPAGFEAQDRGPIQRWDWNYWWSDQVIRDEMAAFAIRKLKPGVQRITYRAIAQSSGRFTALPPRAYDMYNPATEGTGVAAEITVR